MNYTEFSRKNQVDRTRIIYLSVNNSIVRTKAEGENKTGFRVESFDLKEEKDLSRLRQLFQQNVHSINKWNNPNRYERKQNYTGHSKGENFQGVFGIALDYDDGSLTIEEAKEQFKDYIHIIYTSSSHRVDKSDKNGVQRFRIILPFKPQEDGEAYYTSKQEGNCFYAYLKWKFPEADSTVFECGRKLFPFAGKDHSLYEFNLNTDGEYYFITRDEITEGIQKAREERIRLKAKEQVDLKEEKKHQERIRKLLDRDEARSRNTQINRTIKKIFS